MLPRLLSIVLRRAAAAAALVIISLIATFLPARAVLLALWPSTVDEVLVKQPAETLSRQLLTSADQAKVPNGIVQNRPISLWRIETRCGDVVHAWLGGVRDNDSGALLTDLSDWLQPVRIDPPWPDDVDLVLIGADEQTFELATSSLERMYRPNALGSTQRLTLARDRFVERWRWPGRSAPVTMAERHHLIDGLGIAAEHQQTVETECDA